MISGLHHVTAITGRPADNLAFYTGVLGLRLVKKTVNQDDVTAYHLFYGDEAGRPGTEVTFFSWPDAPRNRPGTGSVARISLAVPGAEALAWWRDRFARLGVQHGEIMDRRGHPALRCADPEGQRLELVAVAGGTGTPWAGSPVPVEVGIRGLHGVTVEVATPGPTIALMTAVLGFRQTDAFTDDAGAAVTVLEGGTGGAGTEVAVIVPTAVRPGHPGIGGVHHVAFRTADDAAQRTWQQRLRGAGVATSPIVDRYYFKSVYFHEPGGTLFEIATDGPGFAADEPAEHLGERLALPPFLEPERAQIEAGLPPLPTTGADR